MSEETNFFSNMSPLKIFVLGIVEGGLILCTIGFLVLLPKVGPLAGNTGSEKAPTVQAAAPTNGGAPAPAAAGNVSVSAVDPDTDHIRGDKNAKITIVEFSDFECPFCQRFHDTMKQVVEKYDGEVNWVYRHFPLTSIHANAMPAAVASECAGEQGKFWEYADLLFANQSSLNSAGLTSLATQAGLNVSAFTTCVESGKYANAVQAEATEAQNAGGRGTPYSVIIGPDGEMVPLSGAQPLATVEAALGQFLN